MVEWWVLGKYFLDFYENVKMPFQCSSSGQWSVLEKFSLFPTPLSLPYCLLDFFPLPSFLPACPFLSKSTYSLHALEKAAT